MLLCKDGYRPDLGAEEANAGKPKPTPQDPFHHLRQLAPEDDSGLCMIGICTTGILATDFRRSGVSGVSGMSICRGVSQLDALHYDRPFCRMERKALGFGPVLSRNVSMAAAGGS